MAVTTTVDFQLLLRARAGDHLAFTELYERHRAAALRLARSYSATDAEDLVHGAFEQVMNAIRRGCGPDEAFRPYLYVTLRHLALARASRAEHESLDQVPEGLLAVSGDPAMDASERAIVDEAFAELPERWQAVLWLVAVEGRQPREVARATGLHANTVAVLAHRARERLRQTYLQAHVRTAAASCEPHRSRLGAYVRGGLGRRRRSAAAEHVSACEACGRLVDELDDVNKMLARAVLPVFALGADRALAAGGAAGATATGSSGAGATGAATGATGAAGASVTGVAAVSGATAGIGAGAFATVAVVVAAVVGFAALAPYDRGAGADPPTVEARGHVVGRDRTTVPGADTRTSTDSAPVPEAAAAPPPETWPAAPSTGAEPPAPSGLPSTTAAVDIGLDVDLGAGPVEVGLQADVEVGLQSGVSVSGAWTISPLGTGTLTVDVANPDATALTDAQLVVELSGGAALLRSGCGGPGSGLVGIIVGLLRDLTCGLGHLAAGATTTVTADVAVAGPGQLATIRLEAGGTTVASAVVPLPEA